MLGGTSPPTKSPGHLLRAWDFAHDAGKLKDVLADLYRDEPPDPMAVTAE
jgi:hypothetical protein